MTIKHSLGGLLHRATHRLPGVPPHAERPAGVHGHARHPSRHHSHSRPPRFMPAWQRRVAGFFGREV
ncbi:hypothetical protein ACFO1B_35615 [Dactylosporangium siamense]|uniref:Uncharacterized protein n=1 Tax=Dactylosporangium siamense TaxID=685454 RepID=A0A919PLD1_9ACTN|nr:hypothetical protein [Dactylosporangium siamense]GIG45904.1 hypothetical protein Dsi01nite_039450 [Dactylosporangium siamense]